MPTPRPERRSTRAHGLQSAGFAVLVLLTLAVSTARATMDGHARNVLRSADLRGTQVALYALDLSTNQELISIDADAAMMPASNMKLVTTSAALGVLGPDFMFRTELRLLPAHGNGAGGDPSLLVVGDGDPAFCDNEVLRKFGGDVDDLDKILAAWVDHVKQAGVNRVSRLIVDDTVFDRQFVHPTWPRDQLNRWYCAQVAGLNFYTNCLDIYPEPLAPGQSPRVRVYPYAPFISTINRATSGGADTFWVARQPGSNDLTFMGKIKSRRSVSINVTLDDPPMFFGQLLASRLRDAGVTVGQVTRPSEGVPLSGGRTIHVIQTGLAPVLARCNKDSQNLYAEALLKRMGRRLTGAPGSWENGAAAVRLFLSRALGTSAASFQIADGSGLSRDNRVTPRNLVSLLRYMYEHEQLSEPFLSSLAVAGEDGTLEKRLRDGLHGQVLAKSGYISGVSCLSGYLILANPDAPTNQPRVIAFSFLFNNVAPNVHPRTLQDRLVKLLDGALAGEQGVRLGG